MTPVKTRYSTKRLNSSSKSRLSSRHLIFADYDRTLFDTSRFTATLIAVLSDRFGIDEEQFETSMPDFSEPQNGYNLFAHTTSYGCEKAAVINALQALDTMEFLYTDSPAFIESLLANKSVSLQITTTGFTNYQQFKTTGLRQKYPQLPVTILDQNKGRWLADQWPRHVPPYVFERQSYEHVSLIDDSLVNLLPLLGFADISLYQLQRPETKYLASDSRIPTFVSLEAVYQSITKNSLRS